MAGRPRRARTNRARYAKEMGTVFKPLAGFDLDALAKKRRMTSFGKMAPLYYFTMHDVEKIGVRPLPGYVTTPLGVYAYPLTPQYLKLLRERSLPYQQEAEYITLLELMEPKQCLHVGTKSGQQLYKGAKKRMKSGGFLKPRERPLVLRNQLFRDGFTSVYDDGTGTIHDNEPDQMCFMSPTAYRVVKMVPQGAFTRGRHSTLPKLLPSFLEMARSWKLSPSLAWMERNKRMGVLIRVGHERGQEPALRGWLDLKEDGTPRFFIRRLYSEGWSGGTIKWLFSFLSWLGRQGYDVSLNSNEGRNAFAEFLTTLLFGVAGVDFEGGVSDVKLPRRTDGRTIVRPVEIVTVFPFDYSPTDPPLARVFFLHRRARSYLRSRAARGKVKRSTGRKVGARTRSALSVDEFLSEYVVHMVIAPGLRGTEAEPILRDMLQRLKGAMPFPVYVEEAESLAFFTPRKRATSMKRRKGGFGKARPKGRKVTKKKKNAWILYMKEGLLLGLTMKEVSKGYKKGKTPQEIADGKAAAALGPVMVPDPTGPLGHAHSLVEAAKLAGYADDDDDEYVPCCALDGAGCNCDAIADYEAEHGGA